MTAPPGPSVLEVARALADDLLAPAAERVDRADRVPSDHLRALADAGLFGLAGPVEAGGADLDGPDFRRVVAAIGGGCGATFFVWVQHHGVVRTVRSSTATALRDRVLGPLCRGDALAGTAFAHLRRTGAPAITAQRTDGGWRLDGFAPWITSWGLADWFTVAGVAPTDVDGNPEPTVVWTLVPGTGLHGLAAEALALPVFGATGTVQARLDGVVVADEEVLGTVPLRRWQAEDRRRAALGQPAVLGVAERAIRLLRPGPDRADPDASTAAARLDAELARRWADDDALLAATAAGDDVVTDAADHRAAVLDLARRATTALLAATGGRGMALDHPAQRLVREAAFYVIQAQTADGRAAVLRR